MSWALKSESDTEKVYAQHSAGHETGRYRYVFADSRPTIEVGKHGADGRTRPARHPRAVRHALLAALPTAAVLGDLAWHALR